MEAVSNDASESQIVAQAGRDLTGFKLEPYSGNGFAVKHPCKSESKFTAQSHLAKQVSPSWPLRCVLNSLIQDAAKTRSNFVIGANIFSVLQPMIDMFLSK
jgi:hypothetical protein